MQSRCFRVCAAYDTETCNIGEGVDTRAYPVLFIVNDFRGVSLTCYKYNISDDVRFFRYASEMFAYIDELVAYGIDNDVIPIICAYNMMFDLQPLLFELSKRYELRVNAQSSTSAYTLDLYVDSVHVLRFWDTFYLEMNGLEAMGKICGLPKAVGSWDYSLIRTPETVLTDDELFYAKRDVQVIPAYLQYLLRSNEWLREDMLGCRVITKTSLVRQMAVKSLSQLKYTNSKGHKVSLAYAYRKICEQEFPSSYDVYALRKACFRGGLTFTSANFAMQIMQNVASLDVTSMHHTFINGRLVPVHFQKTNSNWLRFMVLSVFNTSREDVLRYYYRPFDFAFHVKLKLTNVRLRKNSIFARCGIGILSEGKFSKRAVNTDLAEDVRGKTAEAQVKVAGFHDEVIDGVFAYGKLMEGGEVSVYVNEIEAWDIYQVYEFDSFEVVSGEATQKFTVPPDYVSLQSNVLFERKQAMKTVLKKYVEGVEYEDEISTFIPEKIANELRDGSASLPFLENYYNSTVKGQFNGIYGTQAMDLMRPNFMVVDGEILIDPNSKVSAENFIEMKPKKINVLYTYGMRIVAGSRQHLIIALQLLDSMFGELAIPTGGDTDSIKVSLDSSITNDLIQLALQPLADASDNAIRFTQRRNRKCWADFASDLNEIGHFDIEKCGSGTRWSLHMEGWNKARISEVDGFVHVTCAGLSRPVGMFHIEAWCNAMLAAGYPFKTIAQSVLGFNTFVTHDVCHALQHYQPSVVDMFNETIADYQGKTCVVNARQSIALYPVGRWLGEVDKVANAENIRYLKKIGRQVDTRERWISKTNGVATLEVMNNDGDFDTVMRCEIGE